MQVPSSMALQRRGSVTHLARICSHQPTLSSQRGEQDATGAVSVCVGAECLSAIYVASHVNVWIYTYIYMYCMSVLLCLPGAQSCSSLPSLRLSDPAWYVFL